MDATSTPILRMSAASEADEQLSRNESLSRNYRRRRKDGNADRSSSSSLGSFQRSALIFVGALVSINAFSVPPALVPVRRSLPATSLQQPPSFSLKKIPSRTASTSSLFSSIDEDGNAPDEVEWRAMLAAFQMYNAAYGNLKVPLRFVVPALAPWPEQAWSLKLGQKVAAIRSTGKFVHNEQRRKTLEDMGFVWRLRAASSTKENDVKGLSFEQLYGALVAYRENMQEGKGALSIPNNFVVPDCDPWPENARGLPLGRKLASIRSKSFLAANPGAKEKLKAVGFQLDGKVAANDARFQLVYDALKRYKEIFNDLLVPQPFVVPEKTKEWPEQTWGLRLGARVNAIRSQGTFVNSNPERKQLLDDLGFVWNPTKTERGSRRGRRRKEETEAMEAKTKAMAEQAEANSDEEEESEVGDNSLESLFGSSFDFSTDAPPELLGDGESEAPTWGLEGGRRLEDAARRAEVEAQAAQEYKPPMNLADSLAAAAERAADVGVIERMTEEKRIIKGKREKNIPWFNDDFGDEFVFDDVVEALSVYKSLYGDFSNLTADSTFTIPSRPDEFSDLDSSAGLEGNADSSSRAAAAIASFEERRRGGADMESEDSEVMVRGVGVSTDSEISANDWPEHLGGMSLGNIVNRIKDGSLEVKHLPDRKAKLNKLKFEWGDAKYFLDVPFEKAMCAMYAYYLIRGDMFVYQDFVMPDEDPWPQALAGYKVGEAVHRLRELQHFMEAYHPEKVSLLRMIDFVWFPTLALSLDPNEPEMTPELEMLSALGHPDYARMIDIPMGLPEKILADGPFFETDDPKLWWRKWHNWDYVQDYWYHQRGRRDNGWVLRESGYPKMADEHEGKYGTGLFAHINETMTDLQNNGIEGREDLSELHEKLVFYRAEMTDCKDIPNWDREKLLEDMDTYLLSLSSGTDVSPPDGDDYEYEEVDEEEDESNSYELEGEVVYEEEVLVEEEVSIEAEEEELVDEEFDVEDELGLSSNK